MAEAMVSVEAVSKYYRVGQGLLPGTGVRWLRAVDGVTFEIAPKESVGLVGESGCGKSTTASMVLQLASPTSGVIRFEGHDINRTSRANWSAYRRSVQAVFQDPYSSLNPRMRVRDIIAEPLVVNAGMTRREIDHRVAEVVAQVGLPPEAPRLYPHEFSGGQRQRVAVARSLVLKPRLIVLDEPVSGLDVSIKAQILNLLKDLQRDYAVAYLMISHNLADVRYLCDRVMVMYLGRIVETGPVDQVFADPLHPYTRALMSAALTLDSEQPGDEVAIAGEVPSPVDPPSGCAFHPRCPVAMDVCRVVRPTLEPIRASQLTACHLYDTKPDTIDA